MKTPAHILERNRQWRARNPEKANASCVKWQKKNWDKYLEYHRKWGKENRDKIRPKEDRWKAENSEKAAASIKNWREANKERYRVITRRARQKWMSNNPDKVKDIVRRRRVLKRTAAQCDKEGVNLLCQLISDTARLKCGICGKNMPKSDRTIDHVIPVSKGGSGEIWNLRIVHRSCNSKKNAKMPDELNFAMP